MTHQSFLDDRIHLYGGDSREVLKQFPDNHFDSIVTDPPYALVSIVKRFGGANAAPAKDGDVYARASSGFMGKQWDTGETAFAAEFWAECLRVLKPGGHVAAFSGTRTYHRMAVAIEDAGFEIRDQLAWCYFSGFPKSHNVGRAIDKHLGADREKVRVENPRIANMPTANTGAGRPWLDAALERGYHEKAGDEPATPQAAAWNSWGTALKPAWEPIALGRKPLAVPVDDTRDADAPSVRMRPATVAENVLEHGTGALNIDGCRIGDSGGTATVTGDRKNTTVHALGDGLGAQGGSIVDIGKGMWPANILTDGSAEVMAACGHAAENVARLYFSAKADKLDRIGSKHPTVKPVDLMQWLIRLVTPKGGLVLDPFAGSGSTGEAAWREGMRCVLVEREAEYQADIAERLQLADAGPTTRKARAVKQADNDNLPLFGGISANGGGVGVATGAKSTASSPTKPTATKHSGDGGIMAGKGGFGFRIREHAARQQQ